MERSHLNILGMGVGIYSYCPIQIKSITNDNAVKIRKVPTNVGNKCTYKHSRQTIQYRQSDRVTTHRITTFIGLNAIKGEFS